MLLKYLLISIKNYHNNLGNIPKGLSYDNVKRNYIKERIKFKELNYNNPNNYVLSDKALEVFYYLFSINKADKEIKDLLLNWKILSNADVSRKFSINLAKGILNSSLKNGYYYKKVQEIFSNDNNKEYYSDPYYFTLMTLSFIKDGNEDFAISYFFENLSKNIELVNESDKNLLNYYEKF